MYDFNNRAHRLWRRTTLKNVPRNSKFILRAPLNDNGIEFVCVREEEIKKKKKKKKEMIINNKGTNDVVKLHKTNHFFHLLLPFVVCVSLSAHR
jgi:hypothetical protein